MIRFIPQLPHQVLNTVALLYLYITVKAAFSLYNYLIGYIMFYVRTPREQVLYRLLLTAAHHTTLQADTLIGSALSLLWMVVHSVQVWSSQLSWSHVTVSLQGIGLKDLKQILRKEQVSRDSRQQVVSISPAKPPHTR